MDFKAPYVHAMREQAPRMFNALVRSGGMDAHLQRKSHEAHQMLEELLAHVPKEANGLPKNPQDLHRAEEIVRATLIEFPPQPDPERAEPPDDLPQKASQIVV